VRGFAFAISHTLAKRAAQEKAIAVRSCATDFAGAAVCLVGAAIILYGARWSAA
jgi:drug/metabolite transporter superfamily protein YnfA